MRVFQPTYTDRNGKTKKAHKWNVTFKDHKGTMRRLVGFPDKTATEALGRRMEKLASNRAMLEPLNAELAKWVDNIEDDIREKLIEWDILDACASMSAKPLTDHLDDWRDYIINAGKTEDHADLLFARVNRLVTDCQFVRYANINESRVMAFWPTSATESGRPPSARLTSTSRPRSNSVGGWCGTIARSTCRCRPCPSRTPRRIADGFAGR